MTIHCKLPMLPPWVPIWLARPHRVEKMCRETLEGVLALSMEVVSYRVYSEHRKEPDATAPQQDPMPVLQWTDMKWSFVR